MSIFRFEVPDEKRAEWEACAAACGLDFQTWASQKLREALILEGITSGDETTGGGIKAFFVDEPSDNA